MLPAEPGLRSTLRRQCAVPTRGLIYSPSCKNTRQPPIRYVIAFHEKAGRSQVVSLSFLFVTRFFSAEKNFSIYWGRFQPDEKRCQKCGHYAYHPQEKKTDVNIATQLICDAFHDRFDAALIV